MPTISLHAMNGFADLAHQTMRIVEIEEEIDSHTH